MGLIDEIEKSMRYEEWYREIVSKNVSFDIQEGLIETVKAVFEALKGMAVMIGSFEEELYEAIRDATGMKCLYHINAVPRKQDNRRKSMINEKIEIIYENNAGDIIVCGEKEPGDPAFYDGAKYIVSVKMRRILIVIEDKLYIMPLEVKYINIRGL
jgi:hypothetical protein